MTADPRNLHQVNVAGGCSWHAPRKVVPPEVCPLGIWGTKEWAKQPARRTSRKLTRIVDMPARQDKQAATLSCGGSVALGYNVGWLGAPTSDSPAIEAKVIVPALRRG